LGCQTLARSPSMSDGEAAPSGEKLLYMMSPKERDTPSTPLTLPFVTHPPAAAIRSCSWGFFGE
jgi:hypothetical protein